MSVRKCPHCEVIYSADESHICEPPIRQALQLHGGGESRSDFASGSGDNVPDDVAALVVAARIVAFEDQGEEAIKALDEASEAFAGRVAWDDEPEPEGGDASNRQGFIVSNNRRSLADASGAWSGGGEAAPKSETPSNPTLQGPTREEVARIIDPSPWTGTFAGLNVVVKDRDAALAKADAILALLKPTSPWRPIESAPECYDGATDGSTGRIPVLVCRFPFTGHHAPIVVARLTKKGWINGLKGNRLWFEPTHWMPLPALPGGEKS